MREQALVMTSRAPGADGHACARLTSLFGQRATQIEQGLSVDAMAGYRLEDLGADFVATAANGRTEMHDGTTRIETFGLQRGQRFLEDPCGGALPPTVQHRTDAGGMRDEDRNTIGQGHRHCGARRTGHVAVCPAGVSQPPVPGAVVTEDAVTVHLHRRRQATGARAQRMNEIGPAAKDVRRGLRRGKAEVACLTSRGEGDEAEVPEAGHVFVGRKGRRGAWGVGWGGPILSLDDAGDLRA